MSLIQSLQNKLALLKAVAAAPQLLKVRPAINWFMTKYMGKFQLTNVGGQLIIHSHLPAMNSKAFARFVDEHLLAGSAGPSHAQVSLTSACPQHCAYCYNKKRSGELMDTDLIKQTIADLKKMGVVWLGFTGGEPLMQKDLVDIVNSAGKDCALKLFTTGTGLTEQLAADLQKAGLLYVSVSLDHWREEEHDRVRGCQGAYQTALKAIKIFKETAGMHVGVSAVISKEMIQRNEVEEFLNFLIKLDLHEIWLSETKPSSEAFWHEDSVITEEDRLSLAKLQDKYNQKQNVTINYLGHFEGGEHFGCNAGHKMIYVDAFGEVSPCVFTPITLGNVRETPVQNIFPEMKKLFPSENTCFINKNYSLMQKYYRGISPISKEDTIKMMKEVRFSPLAKFFQLYYRRSGI